MNYLSLFSGIGGLDLGLDRAGMACVGQVERDGWCRRVLAKHWPEVPRHDDVRTAPGWWLGRSGGTPTADLVAGGFPCQPFSTAGRREGTGDERWGWPWFWDVVRVVRPRFILVENVAALVADRHAFGLILADLAEGGYGAEWDCIPAASVGAPHRRDRLFLVAYAERELVRDQPVAEHRRGGAAIARDHGTAWDVADANGAARRPSPRRTEPGGSRPPLLGAGPAQPRGRGGPLADTDGEPASGARLSEAWGRAGVADADGRRSSIFGTGVRPGGEWPPEPAVGRVADGVPGRVDRLRGLGNAVVPQVAEHVGRLIMAAAA